MEALGGLPTVKIHCSVLAADALHSAVEIYMEKTGLVKEKKPTTKEIVMSKLSHVVDPLTGIDIVRSGLIKTIHIKDGVVTVILDLPKEHQFAKNIEEEILERLEHLWDVTEVKVIFKG